MQPVSAANSPQIPQNDASLPGAETTREPRDGSQAQGLPTDSTTPKVYKRYQFLYNLAAKQHFIDQFQALAKHSTPQLKKHQSDPVEYWYLNYQPIALSDCSAAIEQKSLTEIAQMSEQSIDPHVDVGLLAAAIVNCPKLSKEFLKHNILSKPKPPTPVAIDHGIPAPVVDKPTPPKGFFRVSLASVPPNS